MKTVLGPVHELYVFNANAQFKPQINLHPDVFPRLKVSILVWVFIYIHNVSMQGSGESEP